MLINPKEDGITHINVYSKGKTTLGRFLSNFTFCPIITEDGYFESIEGYWYWLKCGDSRLRFLSGYHAKELGQTLLKSDITETDLFKNKIKKAIREKVLNNRFFKIKLKNSTLPFTHYYVYENKIVQVPQCDWIIEELEIIRQELKSK